jgi:hypothetical protein
MPLGLMSCTQGMIRLFIFLVPKISTDNVVILNIWHREGNYVKVKNRTAKILNFSLEWITSSRKILPTFDTKNHMHKSTPSLGHLSLFSSNFLATIYFSYSAGGREAWEA